MKTLITILFARLVKKRNNKWISNPLETQAKTFNKLLFEWMQPVLANYCQKHQLDYPELDDEGDVADPNWHQQAIKS